MKGKYTLGIIFILFGVAILLQQLNIMDVHNIMSTWWPLIIIAIGVSKLLDSQGNYTWPMVWIAVGFLMQLRKLDILDVSITKFFWPILFIIIGVNMLFSKGKKKLYDKGMREVQDDTIDYFCVFSALENRNLSKNFRGGNVLTLFGGATIDLRGAEIAPEGAMVDLTTAFGGIDLIVPEHWKVVVTGIPIFGGWSNKTRMEQMPEEQELFSGRPILKIKCIAAFGGIDIKNYI
ncbi:LiaI-LiaF-like domain-containing protein [Clostridium lundense]|uniref:LiaI-LiaF-like domain-containing protein n=1 Tax=Clostridium lundense TaxID=319475 RepID=UPI0004881626|nr:DUF5668 domain-containing protein [Clostridium lundense]